MSFGLPDPVARFQELSPDRVYRRPYTPEEMKPVTQSLLDYGTTGLRKLGSALSAPGDYLRGALGGKPGQRLSGRSLLDQWGLTDPHDKGWGSWGAGLAADIIADPLTYTPLGAFHNLTPAGKALSKAGALTGWGREALLGGFHATEPGLAAAGHSAEDIAHLARGGLLEGVNTTPWRVVNAEHLQKAQDLLGRELIPASPLAGMIGAKIPWGPGVSWSGGAAGRQAARALDWAGNKIMYSVPGAKTFSSLFSPAVAGATDEPTQIAMRGTPYRQAAAAAFHGPWSAQASARGAAADWGRSINPIIEQFPGREQEVINAATALGEKSALGYHDPQILAALQANPATHTTLPEWYRTGGGGLREQRIAGAPITEHVHPDQLQFMHREARGFPAGGPSPAGSNYPRQMGFDKAREALFTQAGGTARIEDMLRRYGGSQDPELYQKILGDLIADKSEVSARLGRGVVPPDILNPEAQKFFQKTLQGMNFEAAIGPETKLGELHAQHGMSTLEEHAKHLADWLSKQPARDPTKSWAQQTLYNPNLAQTIERYGYGAGRKLQAARALPTALAHLAIPWDPALAATHVPIPDVIERMGMQTHLPHSGLNIPEIHGAMPETLRALAPKGAAPAELFTRAHDIKAGMAGLTGELARWGVPQEAVDALAKSYTRAQLPEQLKPFSETWDTLTNLFKSLAFPIWPAAHTKKTISEAITALQTSNPLELARNIGKQVSMMREPGAGLADSYLTRRAQYATGAAGTGENLFSELAGNAPQFFQTGPRAAGRVTPGVPLAGRAGPTGTVLGDIAALPVQGLAGTAANVGKAGLELAQAPRSWREILSRNLGIRGAGGTYTGPQGQFVRQAESTLPLVRAGEKGITNVSDAIRGAQMRGLMEQGYTPEMAAHITNKYQFDYGSRTAFEKNVMSRMVPFYTFASRNIPRQLETLATRPGIPLTQMKPFLQDRDKPAYLPDYLAGHLSAALGPGDQPGHQKFLQSIGLPIEEALSPWTFKGGAPDWSTTAMKYVSQMNPLIKYPLENMFGTQLFSGRKLEDLQAPTSARMLGRMFGEENPQMISQMLANSPLTRFATSLDRLADPKKSAIDKAINLFSGAHITDVDVPGQMAIEAHQALLARQAQMPHYKQYTTSYVPADQRAMMTPEELELSRIQATQERQLREFIDERKRQQRIGIAQ